MCDLEISESLVGEKVCLPGRPEWGVGTVLRVQTTIADGQPLHRVSVQFVVGHRVVRVPPGRLARPQAEPQRTAGWLSGLGRNTLDDQLVALPESVTHVLGTAAQRLAAFAPLYEYTDDPAQLAVWARRQTQVADPLSHWSRDELQVAFGRFCNERDAAMRVIAARVQIGAGREMLQATLGNIAEPARAGMLAALRKPI